MCASANCCPVVQLTDMSCTQRLQDTENTKYLDACLVPGYVLVSKLEKHPSPTILIDLMQLVSTPQMPAPQAIEATRSDTPSTIPSFASDAVVTHLRHIASFRLPELSPSLIASPPENVTNANAQIVPTIDSLWADFCPITQGPTRTYTDCDFLPSPVLLVLGMGDGVCRANLIVRLKDILPGGPLLPSVSHAAQNTEDNVEGADVTVLEWEEWGPKYTCLTRRSSSWANVSVIGYRILGWGAYMDFSPYRIHHPHCVPLSTSQADDNVDPTSKQHDEVEVENAETQDVNEAGETQEEQTPHDTLVTKTELDCRALFAHPITTHLPFRERNCDSFIGGPDETILYFYEDVDGPRLVSLVLSAVHDNWPAIQVCKLG
ncbi:hypothetical protein K474DRAFT_1290997 [Panus rudis PR-1116 ss-1]|nr:hypothetical protein K474DRAFT_1290997 [Panus rudis PR-1116 ss-1]